MVIDSPAARIARTPTGRVGSGVGGAPARRHSVELVSSYSEGVDYAPITRMADVS